jgi:two-component system, OmpR family, sensor histidine kinase QseC
MSMTSARQWSLRSRLLVLLVALTTGLFGLSAIQNWQSHHAARDQLFDNSLRESANLLLQLAEHEVAEHGQILGIALLKAETQTGPYGFRFQIWTPDMQAGFRSAKLPTSPLLSFQADGFGWTQIDGARWRAYSAWNSSHSLQIQIAQAQAQRLALDQQSILRNALDIALLLIIASALIWLIVTASVRPLQLTAESVGERSEQDLRPIEAPNAPHEVQPLVTALNRLLLRIRMALQRERQFTADAAHELRTPLAAIRTNAQVLVAARDQIERDATARDLLSSVDRSTRLIEQLLALARADQTLGDETLCQVDLADIARDQLSAHRAFAEQRKVSLEATVQEATVRADPALLSILVRNLLDNALRYTPSGGRVVITTSTDATAKRLQVEDNGPGIPVEERARVFERFRRIVGHRSTGSGLGLSIVRRIADVHGATVEILGGADEQGTRLAVTFPRSI